MEMAGKPLDPWQQDSCRLMMAIDANGDWACKEYAEWVARQNGKGGILEARALGGFLLFGEQFIAWSAHEYKTAMEAFRRVNTLLRALGTVVSQNLIDIDGIQIKVNNTNGEESFERLDTGARIRFIARSKGSGRGFTADCQIIDEAFAYTAAHQDALAPTTLAVSNEQTIYMSTPPLNGESAEPMYTLRARADAGGDDTLGYRDWGIGGWLEDLEPGIDSDPDVIVPDVDDQALWAASCPALGSRITLKKLVALRRKLGRIGFAREVLGMWPKPVEDQEEQDVISAELWDSLADPTSEIDGPPVFALDMPWDRSSVVIAVGGSRADEKHHVEIVEQRSGSFWVIPWLKERLLKWQPHAVLIDGVGPIASMLSDIQPICESAGIDLVRVTGPEMTRSCGEFYRDCHEDNIRHLGQPLLDKALAGATRSELGDVWRWDRKDSTCDISPVVAATLADHGATIYAGIGAFNIW